VFKWQHVAGAVFCGRAGAGASLRVVSDMMLSPGSALPRDWPAFCGETGYTCLLGRGLDGLF
jgi:hypothetical protein